MSTGYKGVRRAMFVSAGVLVAAASAITVAGALEPMPRVTAECQQVNTPDGSFSMSCEPSKIPNTSTEDNLTEQEVAQPGYN